MLSSVFVQIYSMQHRRNQFPPLPAVRDAFENGQVIEHALGGGARIHAKFLRQVAEDFSNLMRLRQHVQIAQRRSAFIRLLQRREDSHES